MLPAHLDYLFICDFMDGTRYFQSPSDASVIHPLTRSAFWDVQQRLEEVHQFTLVDRRRQHEHTVFLDDGHFKSDGKIIPCPRADLHNFRLIYFRRVAQKLETEIRSHHPKPYVTAYHFGWQANDASGQNFKMILEVKPLGMGAPVLRV